MTLIVSPPVQLVLMAVIVGSAVVMLHPEAVELSALTPTKRPHQKVRASGSLPAQRDDSPWVRHPLAEPQPAVAEPLSTKDLPPLPPHAAVASETGHTPPLPSPPAAPAQPDVAYLGRMIKSDKVHVFLASHGESSAVSTGDVFKGEWLVQSVTLNHITLRHVGNGKELIIPTGESNPNKSTGVETVQIGPRFVASAPAHEQASD